MKKLLVLLMVLGIATAASAVSLSLSPSGSVEKTPGELTLSVIADDTEAYDRFIGLVDSTHASITGITASENAGEDRNVQNLGAFGAWDDVWQVTAADMSEPFDSVVTGTHFNVALDFTGNAPEQTAVVQLMDGSQTVLDEVTYTGIPEPMTIGLLGIGGLFLRRRFA